MNNELEPNNKTILSTREVEVLGLVSKGFASKEIADMLFLSINTVNNQRQNILEKVRAVNTFEAGNYARNLGLLRGGHHDNPSLRSDSDFTLSQYFDESMNLKERILTNNSENQW